MKWIRRLNESLTLMAVMIMTLLGCRRSASQAPQIQLSNQALQERLATLLDHDVPALSVDEAYAMKGGVHFIDTRSAKEYAVSHIPGATYLDYDEVSDEELAQLPHDRPLVIYCSVGYRSERIARRLIHLGYTDVKNLYGSLFEWAERGLPLEDAEGRQVRVVHTYNRRWSQYIDHPDVDEVHD